MILSTGHGLYGDNDMDVHGFSCFFKGKLSAGTMHTLSAIKDSIAFF